MATYLDEDLVRVFAEDEEDEEFDEDMEEDEDGEVDPDSLEGEE